jgi:hypothetical protein
MAREDGERTSTDNDNQNHAESPEAYGRLFFSFLFDGCIYWVFACASFRAELVVPLADIA